MQEHYKALILCTGNSARSQMAEGLLRHMAGDKFEVFSAGTRPVGLNPNAVKAMSEIGIDISKHRSKSVDEFLGQQFDYVITVCDNAKESCPIFPGTGERIHHSFRDPAAAAAAPTNNLLSSAAFATKSKNGSLISSLLLKDVIRSQGRTNGDKRI